MSVRRIIRPRDLIDAGIFGSAMSLWRARKFDPDFPSPVEIGGGIGWFEDEVNAWLESRPRRSSKAGADVASSELAEAV